MGRKCFWHTVIAAGLLLFLCPVAKTQDRHVSDDLAAVFRNVEVVAVNISDDRTRLAFTAEGREVNIELSPRDLRSAAFKAENATAFGERPLVHAPSTTYKGKVAGEASFSVRLNINGSAVEGFFTLHGKRHFIEPASKYSRFAASSDYVVYQAEDMIARSTPHCGLTVAEKIDVGKGLVRGEFNEATQSLRRLDLATEADFEYVTALGGAAQANNEILGILNMVEGVFEAELGISISVVFQHTWSTPDPFSGTSIDAAVQSFRSYWNTNFPTTTTPRDATHLFSGKSNILGRGWAYVGVVCRSPNSAYGVSGRVDWAPAKFLLTAHELAHNVGANHADAGQACANSLMNVQLNGSTPLSFCTYSRGEVSEYTAANGSCLSPIVGCGFDFDGDSKADIAVFRPSVGTWYLNQSTAGFAGTQFGQNGDKPVAADYDGDGKSDIAVFRDGFWYRIDSSTNTFRAFAFGLGDDLPTPADYDGDGKADIAVFRPATGCWHQALSANNAFAAVSFGSNGDVPVPADFDGDGRADINVFRSSNGTWYRINSATNSFFAMQYGTSGDKPVMGDFDGDGKANIAVWRPSNAAWYVSQSNGATSSTVFGLPTDIPAPADYDGDGKADISVYRPSDGIWYRVNSSNNSFAAVPFGIGTDSPVQSYYLR